MFPMRQQGFLHSPAEGVLLVEGTGLAGSRPLWTASRVSHAPFAHYRPAPS
jgi:hypothetical protein